MATEPGTESATATATATKLKLDPPEALQPVAPAEAAGLVPLKTEETSELNKRVGQFVEELAGLDSNSPEFGKKVDQLTAMGRKEIAEAAGASNRFLDRPVKAIDKDSGIGADLTELRRTVEALDPKDATKTRKLLGIIPFGNRVDRYFDKYRSSQTHISKILNSLGNGKDELLMDNAAIDIVKKNNVELVKGVDRASTTTVSALRTAVTVAQAMTNQKLVLEQVTALNTTTANMIDSTGEMLRTQTGAIHEQAASSTIPLETLQRAFQNIYDTMDQIDAFKLQALTNMKQTVDTLGKEVEKSRGYIARAEGVAQGKLEGGTSPLTPIEAK